MIAAIMCRLWVVLFLVVLSSLAADDRWVFFHPEAVTSRSCKTQLIEMQIVGSPQGRYEWQANAEAIRNDKSLGNWQATLASFPPTDKGMDKANKVCMQWMHESGKRIKRAQEVQ